MNIILGAGLTGLGAARTSGFTVLERSSGPGGICRSYYVRPGSTAHLDRAPADGEAYRFEIGGGHWLFGGGADILELIDGLSPLRRYERRAAVWLRGPDRAVPSPIQHHLEQLDHHEAARARVELADRDARRSAGPSMRDVLWADFGPTLFERFFRPFHERYTAGLFDAIEPQDAYKTPNAQSPAARASAPGYNQTFAYPALGLDDLTRRLAGDGVRYDTEVVAIDADRRILRLANGDDLAYEALLSTLPLDVTLRLAGIDVGVPADPHTSVLVLNIGAERGPACPDVHWLYEPASDTGFHRIGFYSNVDTHFLPVTTRDSAVSLYVERAFVGGHHPDAAEDVRYRKAVVAELQDRRFIGAVDVIDASWVESAYTWRRIGSAWRRLAIDALLAHGIEPVGRYARWHFQGMAESLAEGMASGRAARSRVGV